MKKLPALIAVFLFILLGALKGPKVFAANDCSWSINNGLKFCASGDTEQQLRNTRVEFQCTSNCSGPLGSIFHAGEGIQAVDMQNTQIDPQQGIFACAGGSIDQSFINVVRQIIDNQSALCGAVGAAFGIPTMVSGGLSIPLTNGITPQCLQAVNNFHPTIQARLVDKNTGSVLCSKDLTMNVDASRQVTAVGGGLKAGTNIQSGTGLEFCDPDTKTQIRTALGCISTNPSEFIKDILGIGIGLAGGIAFLLILFGGFQIMTSAGNPEQLNAGKELVSSAIAGLLLIIFSIFILRVIGVNILGIFQGT